MKFREKPCFFDAAFLAVAFVVTAIVAVQLQLHVLLYGALVKLGDTQAGLIILLVFLFGAFCAIYGSRRYRQLRNEIEVRRRAERDMDWIASHDALTRLPNRIGLKNTVEQLKAAGKEGHRFVAATVDIVDFKELNNSLGTDGADQVLSIAADRLREVFDGCYLFRLGGDQFYASAEGLSDGQWQRLVQRATKYVALPMEVAGNHVAVTAHAGMAKYPDDASNIVHLLKCSLTALKFAKREKNEEPIWFTPAMDAATSKRAEIDRSLRAAIRLGEVQPYYQPLVDLSSGKIAGFEALARWRREDGSFVSPAEFIPVAEETGLINALSRHLFRQACKDALTWPRDIRLSFNVSPTQLGNRGLAKEMLETLREVGLSPDRLELEITETAVVQDMSAASSLLMDLQGAGVHIALDDFGTGYSSLSQLAGLKFDKLKIDRSFIASFLDDGRQAMITRAMVGLGRALDMTTIAEGIEDKAQAETLRLIGCHQGQGFLFSKAVSAEAAASMANSRFLASVEP